MSDTPAAAPAAPSAAPSSAPKAATPPSGASPSAPVPSVGSAQGAKPTTNLPHGGGEVGTQPQKADSGENNHPDAKPGETKAETIQRIKLKLKVDGQESEKEYTTEELQLLAQKGLGADARFNEAAKKQKAFQSLLDAIQENPFEAFNDPAFGDLGKTYKDKVIQALAKEFQAEELKKANPQEYELQQLREETARYKAAEEKRQAEARERAQKEADDLAWNNMKKEWMGALEKSGFGQNEALIRRMILIGQDYLGKGMDLQPELLVSELKNQLSSESKLLMGSLKGESLASYLGPDILKEVAAYQLSQAQKGKPVQEPLSVPEPRNPPENAREGDGFDKPIKLLRSFKDFRDGK